MIFLILFWFSSLNSTCVADEVMIQAQSKKYFLSKKKTKFRYKKNQISFVYENNNVLMKLFHFLTQNFNIFRKIVPEHLLLRVNTYLETSESFVYTRSFLCIFWTQKQRNYCLI